MRVTRFAAAAIAAGAAATMLIPSVALADNVSSPEPQTSIVPEETNTPAPEDTNTPAPDDTKAPPPVDETETPAPDESKTPAPDDSSTPEPPKDFKFTPDKVEIDFVDETPGNPAGLKLDVTCPTTVSASSNWFLASPTFTKAGDMLWTGIGYLDYEKVLSEPSVWIRVSCAGYGYVVFEDEAPAKPNKPGKPKPPKLTPAKPKVPVGAPQTGDGTTLQKSGMPLAASGSAVALLAMAGITLAARRRVSGQESE